MSVLVDGNTAVVATTPAALRKRIENAGEAGATDLDNTLDRLAKTGRATMVCPRCFANMELVKRGFWLELRIKPMHSAMPIDKAVRLVGG